MVHSNGMETLTARIEYIELFNVGQAFQLGRYPIHFHLIGAVHNSYIKGNAIHQSYNRACTIHGVHYLRVIENVAYNIKGHTFFIEDAAETKNYLENNLAILTKKSWSLLNSDQTPASFWITNPDNIFRGNHAAGADNYGYWFDTKPNPTGPSFDPNICPENTPLGEFSNNVAHSNGRYGLRVFHKLIPRTFPCMSIKDDPNNTTDPYWQNPLIPAVFTNFTSFKNRRNGAIALDIGAVRFENFKVSDNLLAGIEVELTKNVRDGLARIDGALIIGHSALAEDMTFEFASHGIIGPRTEGFQVHNVKFYNFDRSGKAALGTCSHCFSPPSTDSGARTLTVKGLYFDPATTPIKIRYQEPKREIIFDLDGSLTKKGPNTFATAYWRHNVQPECEVKRYEYDGIICNSSVQIRRIVFHNFALDIFQLMDLKVLQIDDYIVKDMTNVSLKAYKDDTSQYSIFPFRPKTEPTNAWAIPVVTGHKYNIHWQWGLDFEKMQVSLSPHWKPTDKDVYIVHNFTDLRPRIDFIVSLNGQRQDKIMNETLLLSNTALRQTGSNVVYNDTSVRQMHYIINGKNSSRNQLNMIGFRCDGACLAAMSQVVVENTVRLWSNPSTWTSGKVPVAGEDVEILPGKNIVFDLEESPIYNYIQINGRLTFKQDAPKLHLRAKYVFVRMGELIIGNETNPYEGEAKITLYGFKEDQHIVYDNAIEAGNKILANTGLIQFYGKKRLTRTRLLKTANPKDLVIQVESGLGWQPNDRIAMPSTTMKWFEKDFAIIQSYDDATGLITLQEPLNNYHWGAATSTASQYSGIDMRGEVVLLTRNIKVIGNDTDRWGCQIVTSDFTEENKEVRIGRTYLDFVEVYNCSQYDTQKAAIRFEGNKEGQSKVSNCAIHNGWGIGMEIKFAENILVKDNNFYSFYKYGINIVTSKNITLDGNYVFVTLWRHLEASTAGDPTAAIAACGHQPNDQCQDISLINNIVASVESARGIDTTGYTVMHHRCGQSATQMVFRDNIAHSVHGYGAIIFRNETEPDQTQCIEASYFTAYKCQLAGIVSNQATNNVMFQNMVLIDNGFSAVAMIGLEGNNQSAKLRNIKFYGETEASECPNQPKICEKDWDDSICFTKVAIMPSSYAGHNKPALINSKPSWPQFKIKADASFGGETTYENLQFINFRSGFTQCGARQRLIELNRHNADYYPPTRFFNTRFENVDEQAMAYLMSPPPEWANIDDCGQFPCTSPNNVLIQFTKSTFVGSITPLRTLANFQIISGLDENSGKFESCKRSDDWNAYYCTNEQLAVVTFESLDEDKLTRLFSPITITNEKLGSRNVLNTFMDHLWDGFYTSMKRLSRFPALIQAGNGLVYDIDYKGTPPLRQKFTLRTEQAPATFRIKYPKAGAYIIKNDKGVEIKANPWDNSIQAPALIKGEAGGYCGENRYVGVVNILEFYLTKGCTILIEPIDSIQSSVRMNWTLSEFFKDGGTTKFVDRIAASLGIKVANVKVVSVYQGSVVVDFQVIEDAQKTLSSKGGIDKVQNTLTTQLTSKAINLGAPIMNVQISSTKAIDTSVTAAAKTSSSSTNVAIIVQMNPKIEVDTYIPSKPVNVIPGSKIPFVSPIIYQNTTVDIIRQEDESKSKVMIYAVIGSIIGVVILGGIAAFLMYKHYQAKSELKAKTVDISSKADITHNVSQFPHDAGDEQFEEQFHPRATDFVDIFGRGDPLKKQNLADNIVVEDEDEDMISGRGHANDSAIQGVDNTTRNLITNVRESNIKEDVPLNNSSPVGGKELMINSNYNSRRADASLNGDEEIGIPNKNLRVPQSGRQLTFNDHDN